MRRARLQCRVRRVLEWDLRLGQHLAEMPHHGNRVRRLVQWRPVSCMHSIWLNWLHDGQSVLQWELSRGQMRHAVTGVLGEPRLDEAIRARSLRRTDV